jgi:cellobiose PTS system EIIC component
MSAARATEAIVASIEARLFPVLRKISLEPHMAAVRESMGPSFAGLIAVTVMAFFVPPELPLRSQLSDYSDRFYGAYHIGFGAMGVVLAVLLADRLARTFEFNRVVAMLISLAAFASALKWPLSRNLVHELGDISSTSILLGLVVALVTGEVLRIMTARISGKVTAHAAAVIVVAAIFGGLAAAHVSLGDALLALIRPLVSAGDTLPGLLVVVFFQTLLWTAGVHGPAFLSAIVTPVYLKAIDENSQAIVHHQVPPHVVTMMLSVFYYPGGSGATLALALLTLRSRVVRLRKLSYASILPAIWNINEPLIFGVPLVMNPSLTIPFLLAPLVLATVSYVAIRFSIIAPTVVLLPPVFPSFVSAWLTTQNDWRAVVLVFVNIALAAVIYLPFVRAFEKTVAEKPSQQERLLETAAAIREEDREIELHPERAASQKT